MGKEIRVFFSNGGFRIYENVTNLAVFEERLVFDCIQFEKNTTVIVLINNIAIWEKY